ncbi:MAG TPA: hypothetical protein VKP65_13395, partial [Rhodothermales bacterium]|nr:hypothetical protein [Rhodothermales bacterium]
DIDRINRKVYVMNCGTPDQIEVYDYDGNLENTYATSTALTLGNIALSGDTFAAYFKPNGGLSDAKLHHFGGGESHYITTAELNNICNGEAQIDQFEGLWFARQVADTHEAIFKIAVPTGGSMDAIKSNGFINLGDGLALDKANHLIYLGGGNPRGIIEIDYDGNNERQVIDVGGGAEVVSIDLGV